MLWLGLDGDHADAVADRRVDAADQPAAADRDDHGVGVRRVLFDLEPDGALPGEHERVVERMHKSAAGLFDECVEPRERVAGPGRLEVDRRAVAAGGRDLLVGRALPHDDERVDPLGCGAERNGLRVVAGADRDHAARLLVGAQAADLVQRAARP